MRITSRDYLYGRPAPFMTDPAGDRPFVIFSVSSGNRGKTGETRNFFCKTCFYLHRDPEKKHCVLPQDMIKYYKLPR
ncbi:MAG: hypothetical protein SPJ23_04585 [Eubacteriales bacterium]|nr:hypothetical protein [Eubacteriales bacterium]